jgi:hypothetical protein
MKNKGSCHPSKAIIDGSRALNKGKKTKIWQK